MQITTQFNLGDSVRFRSETWKVKTISVNVRKLADSNPDGLVVVEYYITNERSAARVPESALEACTISAGVETVQRIPRSIGIEIREEASHAY